MNRARDMRQTECTLRRQCRGQILVEFAVALPLILGLTVGIMQMALLVAAKVVVNHAAFVAARAELVGEDPEEAAEISCAPVAGMSKDQDLPGYEIPGRGVLPRSGLSREKTSVAVVHPDAPLEPAVRVDVTHDFELVFPVVGELFKTAGAEHGGRPHRRFVETCTLARRWE